MRNPLILLAANSAVFMLVGCTRPNVGGATYLDGAVQVSAQGTRPRSMISLQRAGALDPASSAMEVMINDADVALHVKDGRAVIDRLKLTLDNVLLPVSADLPHGLELRDNYVSLDEPLRATVDEAVPDTLVLTAHGTLSVHSKMVLSDGSLYQLGPTESEPGDLSVRVTLDGEKATAVLDSTPPATCWSIPGGTPDNTLLQATNCAIFVESFATVEAL
jgi:hypothetical protein